MEDRMISVSEAYSRLADQMIGLMVPNMNWIKAHFAPKFIKALGMLLVIQRKTGIQCICKHGITSEGGKIREDVFSQIGFNADTYDRMYAKYDDEFTKHLAQSRGLSCAELYSNSKRK